MAYDFDLKNIEIKSFRGIKHFDMSFIDTNDKKNFSLVLCGANGTGKSTFVNAFEYLFTGEIKSLKGKGTKEINHDEVIVHKGDKKEDLLIKATIGEHEISRRHKSDLNYPEELEDLVKNFENGNFILNRKKLLNFIESQAGERYNEVSKLIGFDKYNNIQDSLRKCHSHLNKELESKTNEKKDIVQEICAIYDCEYGEVIEKTNEILSNNNFNPITKDDDFEELIEKLPHENNYLKDIDENYISFLNETYINQLETYENISLDSLKSSNILLSILTNSKEYLIDENPDECPVCQNPINNEELINYINLKEEELEKNMESLKNWQSENQNLIKEIGHLDYKLKDHDLSNLIEDLENLTNFNKKVSEMDRDILKNLNDEIISLKEKYDSEIENLTIARQVIIKLAEIQKIEKTIKNLEKQTKIAEITSQTFVETKKETLREILKEIIEYIDKFYKFIHQDDINHTPGIKVEKTRITLNMIFEDEEHNPREYSSEGHIDSLGLCIFLAFVKVFNRYKFIILDDIIATVDMEHKERIARLLFEEFENYTFFITTHSKLWFEQLRRISMTYHKKVSFEEILDWDEKIGPTLSKSIPQEERIEEYIKENDVFAAGNGIRRYFEFILDNVVKENEIKLPLKQHYTLDEYYKPVKKYFKNMFDNSEFEEYYHEIFDEIDKTTYMGNLTSHNNEANYDLTINEIKLFRDAVYRFKKSMTCHKHKTKYLKFEKDKRMAICNQKTCNDFFIFTDINKYINNNEIESAQKALTNYFEAILKRIIKLNEIELPNNEEYTIKDYYESIKLYLKDIFKDTHVENYYDNIFKKLEHTKFMKNLMSNNQDANNDLDKGQINLFKTCVDDFKKSITCNEHETKYLDFKKDIIKCNSKDCDYEFELNK